LLSLAVKINTLPSMPRTLQSAFTLIELLVVIAIIAILATLAAPIFTGIIERARIAQDMNNLRQIGIATQTYLNDNDNALFSTATTWMSQLHTTKYLPAWNIFQSPFDRRAPSELGDATTPISYGINSNITDKMESSKITNPSLFILFAPAQASTATVTFQGTALTAAPGVKLLRALSTPGATATGGTHSSRKRINALCADLHVENMLWTTFIQAASTGTEATQRWAP
jgi:prepilin-type N-terminal cleavage/methylation domain-containing protein